MAIATEVAGSSSASVSTLFGSVRSGFIFTALWQGTLRSLVIKRVARKWFALLVFEVANADTHRGPAVGLDLGLTRLATLSTGEIISNPREGKLRSRAIAAASRALARARRGSKRRKHRKERLASLKRREANARRTALHQYSASLARRFSILVVEDLKVRNMMRSARGTLEKPGTKVAQKSGLNRAIADAGWTQFLTYLAYKAIARRWRAHSRQAAPHEQPLLKLPAADAHHYRG